MPAAMLQPVPWRLRSYFYERSEAVRERIPAPLPFHHSPWSDKRRDATLARMRRRLLTAGWGALDSELDVVATVLNITRDPRSRCRPAPTSWLENIAYIRQQLRDDAGRGGSLQRAAHAITRNPATESP